MTETIKTTMQLKLLPTKEYRQFIQNSMNDYIATVNDIVADFRAQDKTDKRTSKDIKANLPSCLKNQAISDAKSIFKKYKKACREAERWNKKHQDVEPKEAACPVLHKPACIWNIARYIEYKAALAGIRVEYVNPAYTSQICPVCGKHNHAKDRKYQCSCGFHGHRDIVGAVNIRNAAPVADGNSLPA